MTTRDLSYTVLIAAVVLSLAMLVFAGVDVELEKKNFYYIAGLVTGGLLLFAGVLNKEARVAIPLGILFGVVVPLYIALK